jgi:hypothetical protein
VTRRARSTAWFAAALLLAGGAGYWQARVARDDAPAPTATEATSTSDAAPTAPAPLSDAPPVPDLPGLPPLPPASMRLGEAWPALEARALAGDWRAGCRLADALAACQAPGWLRGSMAERAGDPTLAVPPDCSDVPTSLLRRRAIYRLAAAQAGHLASAEAFVVGIDFPIEDLSSAAAEPALIAYREHYTPLRMQLLELGSLTAARGGRAADYRTRGEGPTPAEEAMLQAALDRHGDGDAEVAEGEAGERGRRWLARIPPDALAEQRRPRRRDETSTSDDVFARRQLGGGDPTCPADAP